MIKQYFFKFFQWYIDKSPLLSKDEVSYNQIKSALSIRFKCSNVNVSDEKFKPISEEMLKKVLKTNFVQYIKWTKENFDCDDYSFELCGQIKLMCPNIAFGIAWSKTHAFNIAMLDNHDMVIIEPQTNKIIYQEEYMKNPNYYPVQVIMI